ncbi:hypothetical protein C8F01DRAFT_1260932 [Mycena amicta]|nr:hypothetical protein C8F01DRAFT_1260932 [Mycena amicta]
MACEHAHPTGSSSDSAPNRAISAILPPGISTLAGPLIVVKHRLISDPHSLNANLEILQINANETDLVNQIVQRWVSHLSNPVSDLE